MIFAILGGVLISAGAVMLFGRVRVGKNMQAAKVMPASSSPTAYATVIAVGLIVIGVASLVMVPVISDRNAVNATVDRMLKTIGLGGIEVGFVVLAAGALLFSLGFRLLRIDWRMKRRRAAEAKFELSTPPPRTRLLNTGSILCAFGALLAIVGAILLGGAGG